MSKGGATSRHKHCFFITPIGDAGTPERQRADWVFHHVIEAAAKTQELKADRADLIVGASMIGTNIFRAISESEICIADMTGLNPNVLYEMGVRHSLRKPIIHIAQTGTRLPFDTAPHLTHFYDLADYGSMNALQRDLATEMAHALQPGYEVTNPFTQALGNIEISRSGDSRDQILSNLISRMDRIENRIPPPRKSFTQVTSEMDARETMERFIETSKTASQPYNEITFRESVEWLKDDDEFIIEVATSLSESRRKNKIKLQEILETVIFES